jgi:hypothetical protein
VDGHRNPFAAGHEQGWRSCCDGHVDAVPGFLAFFTTGVVRRGGETNVEALVEGGDEGEGEEDTGRGIEEEHLGGCRMGTSLCLEPRPRRPAGASRHYERARRSSLRPVPRLANAMHEGWMLCVLRLAAASGPACFPGISALRGSMGSGGSFPSQLPTTTARHRIDGRMRRGHP